MLNVCRSRHILNFFPRCSYRVEGDLGPSTSGRLEMGGVSMIPVPQTVMPRVSIQLPLVPLISGVKGHTTMKLAVPKWQ